MKPDTVVVTVKNRSTSEELEHLEAEIPEDRTRDEVVDEIARLKEKYVGDHPETYNATDLVEYIKGSSNYKIQKINPEYLLI